MINSNKKYFTRNAAGIAFYAAICSHSKILAWEVLFYEV